jgi:hypothetical protein
MTKVSLKFEKLEENAQETKYSDGCSGSRSACCTRVCTRVNAGSDDGSLDAWDAYLDVNAGVLQY